MDFDLRLDHQVATARCLSVAGVTLRSLVPFMWSKSGETVRLYTVAPTQMKIVSVATKNQLQNVLFLLNHLQCTLILYYRTMNCFCF